MAGLHTPEGTGKLHVEGLERATLSQRIIVSHGANDVPGPGGIER